ncbi:hypothetical protein [Spongiibacter pelagi]|uniref:hypothetical protein n=1 Tax=Spongiibacter pelagi TaxID=2760804 RepID=UPI00168208DF|nr:hypothetical protein [Spongiibacter pelagi]
MKKFTVLIAMVTALIGCSAPGPMYQPLRPSENNAVVYIYRLPKFFRSAAYVIPPFTATAIRRI